MFNVLSALRGKAPAGIWCENDVVLTSMRRDYVASTLIRRHFRTKCPLGPFREFQFTESEGSADCHFKHQDIGQTALVHRLIFISLAALGYTERNN